MNKDNESEIGKLSYTEAVAELEEILRNMQNPNCDIDLLANYTARALVLMKHCKERLTKVDEEVSRCLKELE
ncbi:MAG: exodeoxyribonuclease VII small subunit [Muribaculaceae bacterium]|nr:exodeoxyribonuclease VII small subunit [Muribaculaceae bacterium]